MLAGNFFVVLLIDLRFSKVLSCFHRYDERVGVFWTMPRKKVLAKRNLLQTLDCQQPSTGPKGPFRPGIKYGMLQSELKRTKEINDMYSKENLAKIKKMNDLAPELMKAFWAFDKAAVAEGAIPVKYKELIAVAVAVTTQCPYCIDIHANNARKAGASEAEIVEATMVAASLRAGGAVTHATHALLG
jgi:AhpD family alkylhydroperoxidase